MIAPEIAPGSNDEAPEGPSATEFHDEQRNANPIASGRLAFRNVGRELTEEELNSPGLHKLLLDELDRAEVDRESARIYIARFHVADKNVATLTERLRSTATIEIMFGVGVGLGGAILGLAPYFWEKGPLYGGVALTVGILLIVGAAAGRLVKK